MENKCQFSPCRRYRYRLDHDMRIHLMGEPQEELRRIAWIGLNPSTADEECLDPTLRRISAFTRRFGGNAFTMLNLFAFRATDPREMKRQQEPTGGPENDAIIQVAARESVMTIAAWGCHGSHRDRAREVIELLDRAGVSLYALRLTTDGNPAHPLYLPSDLNPIPYETIHRPS